MNEAELVFTHILNCGRTELFLERDRILDKSVSGRLSAVLRRRMAGEPLAYILGKQEFMGLEFLVDNSVLVPRMETEILVETAMKYVARSKVHQVTDSRIPPFTGGLSTILDVGTGSGNIAVSLAALLRKVEIHALDISREALAIAAKNARLNKVADKIRFIHGDLFSNPYDLRPMTYDLIISNPPYIPSDEIAGLQPEVRCEPREALDGGRDGLDFYRDIIRGAPVYLKENGFLLMEMGFGQRKAVEDIFSESGLFEVVEVVKDYSGIDRVIVGKKGQRKKTKLSLKIKA